LCTGSLLGLLDENWLVVCMRVCANGYTRTRTRTLVRTCARPGTPGTFTALHNSHLLWRGRLFLCGFPLLSLGALLRDHLVDIRKIDTHSIEIGFQPSQGRRRVQLVLLHRTNGVRD